MMLTCFNNMIHHLIGLQLKIRSKLEIKNSKVDVLINYWDKMIDKLVKKSEKFGDLHMIHIINQIILIPKEIRLYVLREFVSQCVLFYNIAFSQWRLMYDHHDAFGNALVKKPECLDLIKKGFNSLWPDGEVEKVGMNNDDPDFQLTSSKYQEYRFDKPDTLYNINCFEQIGWSDPFPNEHGIKSSW